MSDSPPPSLLITPDTRRRLQQRYEEAVRLAAQEPCDFARVHDLLAECLRTDPGNILYLDALLANLRRWGPKPARSWLPSWLGGATGSGVFGGRASAKSAPSNSENDSRPPDIVLRNAPELLRDHYTDAATLNVLARAADACNFDDAGLRYWRAAVETAPIEIESRRGLARCLTRQGRFDEAQEHWLKIVEANSDAESIQALNDLQTAPAGAEQGSLSELAMPDVLDVAAAIAVAALHQRIGLFEKAEDLLKRALSASGGDLRIRRELEELQLDRSAHRVEIAKRRAASDAHPKAQSLVGRMEQEHNRLEIDILHDRSERHPDDLSLRLELARRLKKAGNYSAAIQRLEEARADERLAAQVLLELGECWQHLRQFGKALEYYREATQSSPTVPVGYALSTDVNRHDWSDGNDRTTLVGALYRIGVLAAAMDQPAEAKDALTRLLALEPDYQDARQRLDKLP